MVGLKAGLLWFEIGSDDFLNSFFSTIWFHLENGKRGSLYPLIMRQLYSGTLSNEELADAISELREIRKELRNFSPDLIVWDIQDRNKKPPWGSNINASIINLSNYFVTSNGVDLFDVMLETFQKAIENETDIHIINL